SPPCHGRHRRVGVGGEDVPRRLTDEDVVAKRLGAAAAQSAFRNAGFRRFHLDSIASIAHTGTERSIPFQVMRPREVAHPMSQTQTDTTIRPFTLDIPQADLDDLRDRLDRARWPDELPGDVDDGIKQSYVRALYDAWRNEDHSRTTAAPHSAPPQL